MPLDEPQSAKVGQVISIKQPQRSLIGVQTGEGILQLLKVQLEGKKVMTVEEFQRGQKGFIGVSLPC
jgi:methionyl-tRNA formyltransferase